MERATDVAGQIEILLMGLAQRAESAGLADLAAKLRALAAEARQNRKGGGR